MTWCLDLQHGARISPPRQHHELIFGAGKVFGFDHGDGSIRYLRLQIDHNLGAAWQIFGVRHLS